MKTYNLHEYLFYKKLSAAQFAKLCDLSGTYISAVMRGDVEPSDKTMRIISRLTKNRVTKESIARPTELPDDWDEEEEGGKAA
jgi:transcriptional regulator with XRE-family HTH domain